MPQCHLFVYFDSNLLYKRRQYCQMSYFFGIIIMNKSYFKFVLAVAFTCILSSGNATIRSDSDTQDHPTNLYQPKFNSHSSNNLNNQKLESDSHIQSTSNVEQATKDNDLIVLKKKNSEDSESLSLVSQQTKTSVLTQKNNVVMNLWWREITSYLNCKTTKLHHVDHHFFYITTGSAFEFPLKKLADLNFEDLQSMSCSTSQIQGIDIVGFENTNLNLMPRYVWYSFVNHAHRLPKNYWLNIKYSRICKLDLSCHLNENKKDAHQLGEFLKNSSVRELNLSSNNFNASDIFKIFKSLVGTPVQELNVSWNKINLKDISQINEPLKETQICNLDLSHNEFDYEDAVQLIRATKGSSVRELDLSSNNFSNEISNKNVADLCEALKDSKLEVLDLSNNELETKTAAQVINATKGSSIQKINLSLNKIKDENIQDLIEALKYSTLSEINLRTNLIREFYYESLDSKEFCTIYGNKINVSMF